MGLERTAYLLQGVDNLYEIDEVFPVITAAQQVTGKRYGADHEDDVRFRVVADHVRSSLMLMGDGVTPSNEGRGYVLRRLLRRSVRAMRLLGVDEPAVAARCCRPRGTRWRRPTPSSRATWTGSAGSRTRRRRRSVARSWRARRSSTPRSRRRRPRAARCCGGEQAFALHDTYGFPIDLTLEMAAEQGLKVDEQGFRDLMRAQRERARADAKAKKGGHADLTAFRELREAGPTPFTGYTELSTPTTVRALLRDGALVAGRRRGRDRGRRPRDDALLRRVRRPGGGRRASSRRTGSASRSSTSSARSRG